MEITIKKNTYNITSADRFMQTGRYLVLLTQGDAPKVKASDAERLLSFDKVGVRRGYTRTISTFGLDI